MNYTVKVANWVRAFLKFTFQVTAQDKSQQPFRGFWFVFVVDRGTPGELHVQSVREADAPEPN